MLPQPRDSSGAAAAQGEETQSRSHALLDTLLVIREGTGPSRVRAELAVVLACGAVLPDAGGRPSLRGRRFTDWPRDTGGNLPIIPGLPPLLEKTTTPLPRTQCPRVGP